MQLRQQAMYFEIRQKQRLEHDQVSYMKAFDAEKPWPDPSEFAEYKSLKQLQRASRSWDKRVPKSNRYSKKELSEIPPEHKRSAEGEGGGHEAPKAGH